AWACGDIACVWRTNRTCATYVMASNAIMQDPSACLCMALPLRKSSSRRFLTLFAPHNWMPLLPSCFSEPKKKNGSFSIITIKCVEPPMKPTWLDADMRQLTLTIAWSRPHWRGGGKRNCWHSGRQKKRQNAFSSVRSFPHLLQSCESLSNRWDQRFQLCGEVERSAMSTKSVCCAL